MTGDKNVGYEYHAARGERKCKDYIFLNCSSAVNLFISTIIMQARHISPQRKREKKAERKSTTVGNPI